MVSFSYERSYGMRDQGRPEITSEGEASFRGVELVRGDPEVRQHPVDAVPVARGGDEVLYESEIVADEGQPRVL